MGSGSGGEDGVEVSSVLGSGAGESNGVGVYNVKLNMRMMMGSV